MNSVQDNTGSTTQESASPLSARREALRETLIAATERALAERGLAGLRARELAAEVGCSVGAIYNVVDDLDDLVLAVNARTLAALEAALKAGANDLDLSAAHQTGAIASLMAMAEAYLAFAAANPARWRAVFEHRLPSGKTLPDWYLAAQARLFDYVEQPLRVLRPAMSTEDSSRLARTLFSAVHGIVALGLEEKLGAVPLDALGEQIRLVIGALGQGIAD